MAAPEGRYHLQFAKFDQRFGPKCLLVKKGEYCEFLEQECDGKTNPIIRDALSTKSDSLIIEQALNYFQVLKLQVPRPHLRGGAERYSVIVKVKQGLGKLSPEQKQAIIDDFTQLFQDEEHEPTPEELVAFRAKWEQALDESYSEAGLEEYQEVYGQFLVVGLDQAGKTSILNALQDPQSEISGNRPTLGVNIVKTAIKGYNLQIYDVGGQKAIRPRWFRTLHDPAAILFVHDLSETDPARLEESTTEFEKVVTWMRQKELDCPVLLVGNKIDLVETPRLDALHTVVDPAQIAEGVPKNSFLVSAQTNAGILDAFLWLIQELMKRTP